MDNPTPNLGDSQQPRSTAVALLGLGANLGNAAQTLQQAFVAIRALDNVLNPQLASLYVSAPVDAPGPHYCNSAVMLRTTLSPLALLDQIQAIEQAFGRTRSFRNAPRTLDIDLLWYDGLEIETPRLTLPHPRMHQRAFVLMPIIELKGSNFLIHGETAEHWLSLCRDQECYRTGWPVS